MSWRKQNILSVVVIVVLLVLNALPVPQSSPHVPAMVAANGQP